MQQRIAYNWKNQFNQSSSNIIHSRGFTVSQAIDQSLQFLWSNRSHKHTSVGWLITKQLSLYACFVNKKKSTNSCRHRYIIVSMTTQQVVCFTLAKGCTYGDSGTTALTGVPKLYWSAPHK